MLCADARESEELPVESGVHQNNEPPEHELACIGGSVRCCKISAGDPSSSERKEDPICIGPKEAIKPSLSDFSLFMLLHRDV